jgi:WD40 repeat protein
LVAIGTPRLALAEQTQKQTTHVQGILNLAGLNACAQFFAQALPHALDARGSLPAAIHPHDRHLNKVVTELAQLAIAINQAFANGQLAEAKVLRHHLIERYRQARSIGIDLSVYGDLIKQIKNANEALSEGKNQQDKARKQIKKNEFHLRPWVLSKTLGGHNDSVYSATYSPDGLRIVTASNDKTARIWDAITGNLIATLEGHNDSVRSATYSPDGSHIVTASNDKTARVWDALSGQSIGTLAGHTDWVRTVSFSPDGSRIVTASTDKTARIWDAITGNLIATLEGHNDSVRSATYSPDGSRIVTAADDKTARVWDAITGASIAILTGHTDWVYSANFSPDGLRIVTASMDNTAKIWTQVDFENIGQSGLTNLNNPEFGQLR